MKVTYVSLLVLVLVLLSGVPLISSPSTTNYANARYANTQAQSNANECDTGTNCAMNSAQSQGDGSASSPTNLQITETGSTVPSPTATSPPPGQSYTAHSPSCSAASAGQPSVRCRPGTTTLPSPWNQFDNMHCQRFSSGEVQCDFNRLSQRPAWVNTCEGPLPPVGFPSPFDFSINCRT
jgi:hypothetical protein